MTDETRQVITKQTPITIGVVVAILGVVSTAAIALERASDAKDRAKENRQAYDNLKDDIGDMKEALGRIEGFMQKTAESNPG